MRMRYLAGLAQIHELDAHVRRAGAPEDCPAIYYLLHDHNGGKDPSAPDPADRWSSDGQTFVNRTCDCIGGQAWCAGFDRYQPTRFVHLYDGWINTDSMILDAQGPRRCFMPVDRPTPGDMVVCKSGSRGHRVGHIGGIISVPAEWDPSLLACWSALGVVDVAARPGRSNSRATGAGWFETGAVFVRSTMA